MVGEIAFLASNSSDINQLLYYDENDLICLNPWRPVQSREELRALLCCCSHLVDVGYLPYPCNLSKRHLSKRFFAAFVWVHVGRTKRLSQSAKLVTHIPVSRWSRIRRTSLLTQVCRCTTVTGPGFQQQAENELEQHPTHYLANASANRLVEFRRKLACGLFNSIQVLDLDHHEAWITFVHVDNMAEFKTFPETKFTKWLRSQNSYWRRR